MKQRGDRIVMLTAYTMARLLDRAGIDLLVGDSLGNVIMGLETTIPVTLDKWNSRFLGNARSDGKGATFALKSSRTQLSEQSTPAQSTENVPLNEVSNRSEQRPTPVH